MRISNSQLFKLLKCNVVIVSICIVLPSCHENLGNSTNTEIVSDNSTESTDSVYSGINSLSYTVFGHRWNIKDYLKQGEGKFRNVLLLNNVSNNIAAHMIRIEMTNEFTSEVLDFDVANSGTTLVVHSKAGLSTASDKKRPSAIYLEPHTLQNYYGDSVIVSIKEISATRVSGSFSGKFICDRAKPSSLEI